MPISIALLFCVPLGLLLFFEMRWLIRHLLGRYEKAERTVARSFGMFGALLIPLVYGNGLIEHAVPRTLGRVLANGLVATAVFLLLGWPCSVLGLKLGRMR